MLDEVMRALAVRSGEVIIDATFGAGGYTTAILEAGAFVVAIDRDPAAIAAGAGLINKSGGRLKLHQGRFLVSMKQQNLPDMTLLMVWLPTLVSPQCKLTRQSAGFSFQKDGPLDMRMESSGPSAADVVNGFERSELTRIIGILGEERQASRISAEIVERRASSPFETTLELANCVQKVLGRHPKHRIHPATKTFQALRIL